MKRIPFVKMEGCRNDYIYLDGGLGSLAVTFPSDAPFAAWARLMSDRHAGIGGDGLIVLNPRSEGGISMRMWNADGSEGRLCLNGLRCAAKYAAEDARIGESFVVETISGVHPVRVFRDATGQVTEVEVEVGRPDFRRAALPAAGTASELWGEPFELDGRPVPGYGLSVGNPHLVFFLETPQAVGTLPLDALALHSREARFPDGVNAHAAAGDGPDRWVMKTWERGTGPTLACGSGAVAVYAAARRLGRVGAESVVRMPGGEVVLRETPAGVLVLRGPAHETFRGTWSPS